MEQQISRSTPQSKWVSWAGDAGEAAFRAEAAAIGELLSRSYFSHNDSVIWLKPGRPYDDAGKPLGLGPHLHAGYLGVALFLAALGRILSTPEYQDLARRSIAPLRRQLAYAATHPVLAEKFQFKLGGLVGLGAFIYGFTRLSRWLDEPTLLNEACVAATLITPDLIEQDTALDVMYGSAGGILSLLRLDQEIVDSQREVARPLERAIACGEHLLRRRTSGVSGTCGWYTFRPPSCGFGHGASGIAYALHSLGERTGRGDFLEVAHAGLAFERLHYRPEIKNWRSILGDEDSVMNAWCNGAPGIALARLKILQSTPNPTLAEELEIALETTANEKPSTVDLVCCGEMGRAEILYEAYLQSGREDLLTASLGRVRKVVATARQGVYRCPFNDETRANVTFFKGVSGIGYTLLRLSGASSLPCVLALE